MGKYGGAFCPKWVHRYWVYLPIGSPSSGDSDFSASLRVGGEAQDACSRGGTRERLNLG